MRLLALLVLCLPLAADPAAELKEKLKDLERAEIDRRAALAKHCENSKMWKQAVVEYERCLKILPDNKEFQEKLKLSKERADTVYSRPTKQQEQQYVQQLGLLGRDMGKKYWEAAEFARDNKLFLEAEDLGEVASQMSQAAGEKPEKAVKFFNEIYPPDDERRIATEELNRYRAACKLPPVWLSPRICVGAQNHAEYLVLNQGHPSTDGLGSHNETEGLPGYTPDGERAGHDSDIGFTKIVPSMIGMIGTFYHRIPLLDPALRKVGIGWAPYKDSPYGYGPCVINYRAGTDNKSRGPDPVVVAFPPPGYKPAQLAFDNELPDPIPEGEDHDCGTCVTVTWFGGGAKITEGTLELKEKGGDAVVGYLSTPAKPARSDFSNCQSLCFIGKDALKPKTTYQASATATVSGKPFTMKWEFTTGEQMSDEAVVREK